MKMHKLSLKMLKRFVFNLEEKTLRHNEDKVQLQLSTATLNR